MMRIQRWWIVLLSIVLLATMAFLILTPQNIPRLSSHPLPAQSYAEAAQRVEALRTQEEAEMNPVCQPQLMTHGQKADRAVILVHGYTTCPQQFHELGQRFYDLGYNVLLAPLPHHGLADRMTDAQGQLTAEELAVYADETVDIGQGLGEQLTMMGISLGGITAAWAAQNRNDIDQAVIISPSFGFKQIPTPLTAAVMNIYAILPDSFVWWDPTQKVDTPPDYAYPRYSQHALAQILHLSYAVQADAESGPTIRPRMVVVLNANDGAVNNALTMEVVKAWQAHGANVTIYEFEASLKLDHDLIDPNQSSQQIDVVYPRLIDLVNQ